MSVYLATFVGAGLLMRPVVQWAALLAAAVATTVTVGAWERWRWNLGLFISASAAARHAVMGIAFAAVLIAACDALILAATGLRQTSGTGFPVRDLIAVFLPAALHEELLFRGYLYQKLRRGSWSAAIAISSSVFALLHGGNAGVSPLAIANVLIAGVLLALAYEAVRTLWFPIGMHLAWNVVSGPIFGFPVSGFVPRQSVLRVTGAGPAALTGGAFGMEASIFMTAAEIAGIALLWRAVSRAGRPS